MTDTLLPPEFDAPLADSILSLPETPPVPSPWDAIAKFTADKASALTPEQNKEAAQAIAQRFSEQEVDSIMASPDAPEIKLQRIQSIAAEYNDPTLIKAQAAMVAALKAQQTNVPPVLPGEDERVIRARRQANADAARSEVETWKAARSRERGGANDLPGFVRSLIVPDFSITLGNIISKVDPEFTAWDYVTPADRIQAVRERILTAEPAKAREMIRAVVTAADAERSKVWAADYTVGDALDSLLGGIDEKNEKTWGNIWPALEIVGSIPILGGLYKAGQAGLKRIGLIPGSIAHSAGETEQGASELLRLADDGNPLAARDVGVEPEQIAGSLILPSEKTEAAHGMPFLINNWIPEEAKQATQRAIGERAASQFGVRVNDSSYTPIEGGFEFTVRVGKNDGSVFKTEQSATKFLKSAPSFEEVGGKVVKAGDGFVIEYSGKTPWDLATLDSAQFKDAINNAHWGWLLGKAQGFGKFLVESSNIAAQEAAKLETALRATIKPFESLSVAKKAKIYSVLKEYEDVRSLDANDLRALGLTDDEVEGAVSVRRLLDTQHAVKNVNTRAKLSDLGFKETTIKRGSTVMLKPATEVPADAKVVNIASGKTVEAASVNAEKHNIYRFFDETADGYEYGIIPKNVSHEMRALPEQVLGYREGHIMRLYKAPLFIREIIGNGRTVAIATASDLRTAEQGLARWHEANPGRKAEAFYAQEIAGKAGTDTELEQLREMGMMYNTHRKYSPLTDIVSGEADIMAPQAALRAALSSTVSAATTRRWAMAMAKMWDNTYSHLGMGKFNIAKRPNRELAVGKEAEIDEAMRVHNFIQTASGVHPDMLGPVIRGWRNRIADMAYGVGLRSLGNNVNGLSHSISDTAKSIAASVYLFLNPVRSAVMQMTMIPTYFGVRGGTSYLAGGKFFRDFAILNAAQTAPNTTRAVGKRLGMSVGEVDDLVKQMKESGLIDLVDSHVFTIGTIADTRTAQTGVIGEAVQRFINTGKRLGFDYGLTQDKRAAWLMARNRFLTDNGRLPSNPDEWREVASFGEQLTLNQNRSDALLSQTGILSLFTQFMAHQFKMTGRLLSALPGTKAEAGFAKDELRRMAAYSLLSYGTAGYGINELVQSFENRNGPLPDQVRLLVNEGIAGYAFSTMMGLADAGPDGTHLAFSGSFSPTNFVGNGGKYAVAFFQEIMGIDTTALESLPAPVTAPGFGLVKDAANVAKFAYALSGKIPLPEVVTEFFGQDRLVADPEVALTALTAQFFRQIPLTSNTMKAMAALTTGIAVDSKGNPTIEASKGEALAALFGVRSYKELEINKLMTEFYGPYQALDDDARVGAIKVQAKEMAHTVELAMRGFNEGKISLDEVNKLTMQHAVAMNTVLPKVYQSMYYMAFRQELLRSEEMKADKIAPMIIALARRGGAGVVVDDSFIHRIERMYDFPNKAPLLEFLHNQMRIVNHGELPDESN